MARYLERMSEDRSVKQEAVEEDLNEKDIPNWKRKAGNRNEWREITKLLCVPDSIRHLLPIQRLGKTSFK